MEVATVYRIPTGMGVLIEVERTLRPGAGSPEVKLQVGRDTEYLSRQAALDLIEALQYAAATL